MARPVSIDDKSLLETARAVFLEKGISATTSEIAERAGVSEGTLFHRFGTKAALFVAAMRPDIGDVLARLDLERRVGRGDIDAMLTEILAILVEVLRGAMPVIMMSWSNRSENQAFPPTLLEPNPPPLRIARALAGYFDAEMRIGRIRPVDPEILARTCMGGAMEYVMTETLGALHGRLPLPQGMFVRGLADIILSGVGVTPAPSDATKPRRRRKV